jgi:hypothetical protein
MNPSKPTVIQHLPVILRRFVWATIALATLCIAVVVFCRDVLHLSYPYDTPVLTARYNYHDYWMFTDRFHHFHSPDFFTAHAEFIFSYPAPMAVLYKLTYVLTDESTRAFLAVMALTFIAVAVLFGRALLKANVALEPVVALTATTLLLSDPIWMELNRANLEFYVWVFVSLGVWLFFRGKGYGAAACFGAAGAMKLFPFVYLGLLIAKKQYRQVVFGFLVSAVVMVGSLWILCPDVLFAWHTLNANANEFGKAYLYQRLWLEVGFDHSLFALIKMLWRHLPGPAVMGRVLSIYMAVAAIGGTVLFFTRIRYLPVANQLVCLTAASLLLPPSSSDYTLIHLYAPWAVLVFVVFDAARAGREVPGLGKAFACFAVLMSSESEMFFRHERAEGMIKAVALIALWYIAMKYPFVLDADSRKEGLTADAGSGSFA